MTSRTLIAILFTCAFVGCTLPTAQPTTSPTPWPTPAQTPDLKQIAQNYPRLDGSTSTWPLQVVLACRTYNVPFKWTEWGGATERSIIPDPASRTAGQLVEENAKIKATGTHQSYGNLIKGDADLILVARLPSDDEKKQALDSRVTFDARPIALDAFVFLLNVKNPVDDFTTDQLRSIFSGKVKNWKELKGGDAAIRPYQRDRNSGSQELMDALVMKGTPMVPSPDMVIMTMAGEVNAIRDDPSGIGYSVYYYATFQSPDKNVKLIAVDGVKPTADTIARRTYPLTSPVYAVMRADTPPQSTATQFRDWLLTPEGQAAIASSGYVTLP